MALSGDTLTLSSGTLVVGGINQAFDAEIGFGPQRAAEARCAFHDARRRARARRIAALLPDVTANGSFGATFPKGEIDLSASKAVLFGLDGHATSPPTPPGKAACWSSRSSRAADLGGAAFDGKLTAFGTLQKPELSGSGTLKIADECAGARRRLLSALTTPPAVADFLRRSLPADLTLSSTRRRAMAGRRSLRRASSAAPTPSSRPSSAPASSTR